jgi:hypothetical protein
MAYWFLMLGGLLSLVGMLFHGFIGGKIYVTNIKKSDLEPLGKSLSIFSWQFHTIFLFVSAVSLFYIAYNPDYAIAAYPIIGISCLGAILFIWFGLENRDLLKLPGAILMGGIAILAWAGE